MTQGTPLVSQNDCPVHGAVGTVEHYGAFVRLCRARIDELGVTYETVDELAGFSARYTATIRSNSGSCSVYSLFTLARTLALLPVFQHDAAELERLRRRSAWIKMQRRGPRYRSRKDSAVTKFTLHRDFYRQIGLRGAAVTNARRLELKEKRDAEILSRMARKHRARTAALARWKKYRGASRPDPIITETP
jgi:hypothetical protein